MAAPVKINFKMYQGSTFNETLRWESPVKVYKNITSIAKSAPIVITAPDHGITAGWRVKITDVVGMKEINSTETYHIVTSVTPDELTINAVNAVGYSNYTSGGVVEYNAPVDLTGYTARMQIRDRISSTTTLASLTTENGGIVLDIAQNTISLFMDAESTALLTFNTAVYSLEMVKSGAVTPFITGTITLEKEVTR